MFMSFMTTLNETWAQDEDLYVMFDGIGNGSVFYIDNVTLAKVEDTFVATWYYNNAGAAFIGSGSGGFTGGNIPAADNKVSFTLYNLNDIDVTAQIELRASDWSTKTVSGAKQNLLPIPAHGNATIELDVSAGYDATDFWIIYMKNGSNNLSGEEYIFGIELSGAADMTMFQKAQNKAVDDYYPVVGRITNSDSKKGSVNAAFGNTIVYGIQNAIEAVPVDGCSFDGWYSGGSKVSSDAQYAIDTTDILGVPEALETQFSGTPTPLALGDGTLENSDAGWTYFAAAGKGTITRVDGGANNTAKAIQYVPGSGNQWGALAFDVGPAIINDADNRYAGSGAAKYKLTFYARLAEDAAVDSGEFHIFLNSQYHKNAGELAGIYGGTAADYVSTYTNYTSKKMITFTKQWQKFEIEMDVSEQYVSQMQMLYAKGVTNAYQLMIRFDGSEGIYTEAGNQNSGYLIDELSFEKMPDPTPTPTPTGTEPTPTPTSDNTKKEPVGVKWTFDKDFTDSAYFCSTAAKGFITDADVKDGKVKKSFTIYNTGSEDIQVQFSASVLHNGTPQSWEAIKNTEKTVIPAGKSLLITYECDAKVTIDAKGLKAEYTYDQFFPRIDITNKDGEGKITAGTEFIVAGINVAILEKLDTNAKDSVTRTVVYELPTSGGSNNGDLLPVALITAVVAAAVTLAVVVAKKKKEQE